MMTSIRLLALTLGFSLLLGFGLAAASGPVVRIDLQTSRQADPSTITPTYTGADSVLYAFLVITDGAGDLVTGISLGFELEEADSVTNEGFTFLADWQVSGNGYGFYPPPSGTALSCPAAVGYWTLHLRNGNDSHAKLRLLPPGAVNGDLVLVLDAQHRALAAGEIHHAGINQSAPDPEYQESLADELPHCEFHVLTMYRGNAVTLPPGTTGAPIEAVTEIDSVLAAALTPFAPLRLDMVSPFIGPADSVAYTNDGYPIRLPPIWKTLSFTASRASAVDSVVAELRGLSTITYAEADTRAEPMLEPNDPYYVDGSQTNLNSPTDEDIDAPEAWDITTGSPNVLISIVDSGIDDEHPDLVGRTILGDSGEDCEEDAPYHGTSVAGVLAARTNNILIPRGIAAVNWGSPILNECVDFSAQQVATAMDTSVVAHAAVINFSGRYIIPDTVETVRRSVMRAMMAGTTVVAPTGNNFELPYGYPAAWDPICIGVGIDQYVTHGPWMDLVAPGRFIWTLTSDHAYGQVSGTSLACPHVAGVVSLIASVRPGLFDRDHEEIVERTAVDLGDTGFDDIYGWGRVNAAAALQYVQDRTIVPGVTVPPDLVDQAGDPSDWFTVHWDWPPLEYPSGDYQVRTYEMVALDVPIPLGFTEPPDIWLRLGGTVGLENPPGLDRRYDFPWGEVFDVTTESASFRTYVYEVRDLDDNPIGWWPAPPEQARFCYTVAGYPIEGAGVAEAANSEPAPLNAKVVIGSDGPSGWSATIMLRSPVNGSAIVDVFDAGGRLVRAWREVPVAGGIAETLWDGRTWSGQPSASGVYFARVAVGGAGQAVVKFVRIAP